MNDIPEELRQELGGAKHRDPDRKYTAHDLVLSYIAHADDGATANDLLVYLWKMTGKVTSRPYLYRILTVLRQRGQIETTNQRVPGLANSKATALGRKETRPLKESKNG